MLSSSYSLSSPSRRDHIIAWDLETCPIPEAHYTPAHHERLQKEVALLRARQTELDEVSARRLVQSIHPFLAWICCISAVAGVSGARREPISFRASELGEEKPLLEAFWAAVGRFPGSPTWVTFNGKRFDVPFLMARSAMHGVEPTRRDISNTYPYKQSPHADLSCTWPCGYTLDDLCVHLDVPSSKVGFDGSMVSMAVADGRLDDVVRYCEADVVATWVCYDKMKPYLTA